MLRILVRAALPLGGAAGGAVGGALGAADGEGFSGFLYGIYSGPVLGLIAGAFVAWRIDRSLRARRS